MPISTNSNTRSEGYYMKQLRIAHYPQVPCKPFYVSVSTLEEAQKIKHALADYDLFQLKHHIKPDYVNATVLEQLDPVTEEWISWMDENTGFDDLDDYFDYLKGQSSAKKIN